MMSLINFNKGAGTVKRGAMLSPPSRRSNETLICKIISRSEVVGMSAKFGAMFGLDARIALTIFSTVALISTASFYHIVENSNVNKLAYEIKEIKSAVSAYQIDTDSDLPIIETGIFDLSELKSSTKDGWRHSYISYKQATGVDANKYLVNNTFGRFSIFQANDRAATLITDSPYNACSNPAKLCYLWIIFDSSSYGDIPTSYINILDEKVDGADGALSGRVQKYNSDGLLYRLDLIG